MIRDVAVLIGSLRKDSINRKMAHALMEHASASLEFGIVEIRALPLYNQDNEPAPDAATVAFCDAVRAADAVLFVTLEYSCSGPGVLKNAIDVGSRPYDQSV